MAANGQRVVPKRAKFPPLKQRKKKVFYKFHNFLGHETSQCVLFKDLLQNDLKEGRLKFTDKQKLHPNKDIETKAKALFIEPVHIMVVDTGDEADAEDRKLRRSRNKGIYQR